MNILMINGSPRKEGRTGKLATIISKKYNVKTIDLSELVLPIYNGQEEQNEIATIQKLRSQLENADAMIIATPEYHGGMSGALKNAFDFLGSKHFKDKPVAILAVAGGGKGGINALNNMRIVLRALYANVLSRQVVIDPSDFMSEGTTLEENTSYSVDSIFQELKLYTQISKKLNEEWVASNY